MGSLSLPFLLSDFRFCLKEEKNNPVPFAMSDISILSQQGIFLGCCGFVRTALCLVLWCSIIYTPLLFLILLILGYRQAKSRISGLHAFVWP
jgi:hypothetical protein